MLAGATFAGREVIQMPLVFDLATAFPRPRMPRNFVVSIEDAYQRVRSDERERFSYERVRDRGVVAVEAEIRRFARARCVHVFAGKRMRWQRQEPCPLLGEG